MTTTTSKSVTTMKDAARAFAFVGFVAEMDRTVLTVEEVDSYQGSTGKLYRIMIDAAAPKATTDYVATLAVAFNEGWVACYRNEVIGR